MHAGQWRFTGKAELTGEAHGAEARACTRGKRFGADWPGLQCRERARRAREGKRRRHVGPTGQRETERDARALAGADRHDPPVRRRMWERARGAGPTGRG
jgi:hypothetical protein